MRSRMTCANLLLPMTMSSRRHTHQAGAAMRYEQSGRPRLKSFFKTRCTYALTAALIAGLASPSFAGERHRHHHGHHHHGYATAAMLGSGILSLMLSRPRVGDYWYGGWMPTRIYRHPPTVHIVPQIRYIVRPTPPPRIAHVRQHATLPLGCLMIREYQTRIIIGGREVEAYGDACMQPDGSWRRGPPKLVPH